MKKPFLSVIIPCYNEEENIKQGSLKPVHDYLKRQKYAWEVIVSDDGSTDNSKKLVRKDIKQWRNFKLLENPHGGKPSALLYGIKKANGKYILFTDMDQSTPINQLEKLTPYLKNNFDVVIGSRGLQRKNFPLYRRLGAIVFMSIRKSMILSEIDDTQCGFKLFDSVRLKKAFPRLQFFVKSKSVKGWTVTSYDVELLHILKKMDSKIKEVKVKWNDEDVSGSKGGKLERYFKESKEMFMQILRVKLNDMKGLYN